MKSKSVSEIAQRASRNVEPQAARTASPKAISFPERAAPESARFPIVVHSHLRWSFVWQRPQQTHSRLAARHPVLFVEEPTRSSEADVDRLRIREAHPNLLVAEPCLSERAGTSRTDQQRVLTLLREALPAPIRARFARAAHWLYTPLMTPQVDAFPEPLAVVYDCMDELSKFDFASPEIPERERELIRRADLVFTGGYELYLSKRALHPRVRFFGCGVDFDHFRSAARADAPADLDAIRGPRLGYVGVIDERLDYELIRRVAEARPDCSVVMIGPVVKVDPAKLPRAANIHYLGARPYEQLPAYLSGFAVCLMPFAMNEASAFINPTKTLEYLATGKPVVSTPVRDVVRLFSEVVTVADQDSFPAAVESVLASGTRNPARAVEVSRGNSWERIVGEMELLVARIVQQRHAERRTGQQSWSRPVPGAPSSRRPAAAGA
jgi:glycosyltransferase involved in cell wall biosynthesis